MGPFEHPQNSYYAASANPFARLAPLAGLVTADVCVVGGGFTVFVHKNQVHDLEMPFDKAMQASLSAWMLLSLAR